MDSDVWRTIVGSGGISVLVVAAFTAAWRIWENHTKGTRAEDMDDAEWNAAFKSGAEKHVLGYDVPIHHAVLDLQYEINKLRQQSGEPQKDFAPLPDPRDFPLFPKRDHQE